MIAAERYREAIHFCQQELAASPRCVTLRLWLARAFLADGAGAKGVAELEECLRIDPMSAAARELLQDLGVAVPSLPLPALKPVAPKPHAARPVAAPAKPAARPVAAQAQAKPAAPRAAAPRAAAPRAAAPRAAAPRAAASAVAAAQPIHATRERAVLVYEPPPRKTQPPPPLRATYEPPPTTPPHVVFPPSPRVIYSSPSLPPPEPAMRPLPTPEPLPPVPVYEPPLPTFAPPPSVVSARVGHDSPAKAAKARRSASRRRLAFESPFAEESQPPSQPSPSASGWQRPLGIEPRGPERWPRIAVVALGLLGIVLAWRLYREDRAALPVAVVAASRPTPEPPVVKADVPTLNAVGGDAWIHPLAGPQRRMPERDSRLFGAERTGDRPSECRGGHCGVDLAGAYGEPVYAVHDGVVEFVQRAVNPDHGGRFVRLTHRNGTIATQYFHLSQIPSRIAAGVTVRAGDVIGYVGLTGVKHSEPHLHFTIEVQDPSGMDGRYLDPEPLVALWPLRISPKGSELRVSATSAPGLARGFLRRRHRPHHSDDE